MLWKKNTSALQMVSFASWKPGKPSLLLLLVPVRAALSGVTAAAAPVAAATPVSEGKRSHTQVDILKK